LKRITIAFISTRLAVRSKVRQRRTLSTTIKAILHRLELYSTILTAIPNSPIVRNFTPNFKPMSSFFKLIGVALLLFAVSACQRDNYAPQGQSTIKVMHAAPNASDVHIIIDGKQFTNAPLQYTEASYPYNIFLGAHQWTVQESSTGQTVHTYSGVLPANTKQTLYLFDSASTLQSFMLPRSTDALPSGKVALRLVHLCADAPSVYLDLAGNAVCGNTAFKAYSAYTTLDAATLNFELRATGTNTLVKPIPNITLEAGKYYSLIVIGLVNGTGKKALSLKLLED
jgi:hypothetical protein